MKKEEFCYDMVGRSAYFVDERGTPHRFEIGEVKVFKEKILFTAGWHQISIEGVFLTEAQALLDDKEGKIKKQKERIWRQAQSLKKLREEAKDLRKQVLIEKMARIEK